MINRPANSTAVSWCILRSPLFHSTYCFAKFLAMHTPIICSEPLDPLTKAPQHTAQRNSKQSLDKTWCCYRTSLLNCSESKPTNNALLFCKALCLSRDDLMFTGRLLGCCVLFWNSLLCYCTSVWLPALMNLPLQLLTCLKCSPQKQTWHVFEMERSFAFGKCGVYRSHADPVEVAGNE